MKLLFGLLLSTILLSCSATWHLKRAIAKDPTIIKTEIVDTIIKTVPVKGEANILRDTIINNKYLYLSVSKKDTFTKVKWYIKPQKVKVVTKTIKITPPKTRFEIKQEMKYKYGNHNRFWTYFAFFLGLLTGYILYRIFRNQTTWM
jgi:hypothetical protein